MDSRIARIALVGDRSPHVRAHIRIPGILDRLSELDASWIGTEEVAHSSLDRFDGIWLLPGSPYRDEAGAIEAARIARERGIPFLGTCGGFQHGLLEFARNACGLAGVGHGENTPDAVDQLIAPLTCSLVGQEGGVTVTAGSLAERILGAERTIERYHCSYGLNATYLATLEAHGLRFTGHDDDGEVRIAELPGHPFYLATLFQPELAEETNPCHPIIRAFAAAVGSGAAAWPRQHQK